MINGTEKLNGFFSNFRVRFDLDPQFEEKCLDVVNGKFSRVSEANTDDHGPTILMEEG